MPNIVTKQGFACLKHLRWALFFTKMGIEWQYLSNLSDKQYPFQITEKESRCADFSIKIGSCDYCGT